MAVSTAEDACCEDTAEDTVFSEEITDDTGAEDTTCEDDCGAEEVTFDEETDREEEPATEDDCIFDEEITFDEEVIFDDELNISLVIVTPEICEVANNSSRVRLFQLSLSKTSWA